MAMGVPPSSLDGFFVRENPHRSKWMMKIGVPRHDSGNHHTL